MGFSKYSTPNDELQFSINAIDGKERPDIGNEAMAWGNTLEPVILTQAAQRLGLESFDVEITKPYTHPDIALQCSLDGIGFGNGGQCLHRLTRPLAQVALFACAIASKCGQTSFGRPSAVGILLTCVEHMPDNAQGRRSWPGFTQRASRQQPAVARASVIKHAQGNVMPKCMVLHAVIAEDEIRVGIGLAQSQCRLAAFAPDKHGHVATTLDQQWFIACV